MRKQRKQRRACCLLLCLTVGLSAAGVFYPAQKSTEAAGRLNSEQAVRAAFLQSGKYRKKYNEIVLKRVKYEEAVKSVREKQRNLSTFRWSPLLSFKFPQKPNLTQEMEFIFKPLQIQNEITTLTHELSDIKLQIRQEIEAACTQVYLLQEKIAFSEEMLANTTEDLNRNRVRLAKGEATAADVEKLEKSVETLSADLSLLYRNFETEKKKLSDQTGRDVTIGYYFESPLVTAKIDRHSLRDIKDYAITNSQACYEAKMQAAGALENLKTAERLMRSHYGGKLDRLNPYLTACKKGDDVDTAAFQLAYREMLADVDRPWQGSLRILFIRIPKEWFKGQIDGIRYVEDEPYLLYTACLDYLSADREVKDAKKTLESEIDSAYENIVTARNTYESLEKNAKEAQKELDKLLVLNRQGKASLSEVNDKQEDVRQLQMDTLSSLGDYTQLLYTFDRLTCGAVTLLLKGESINARDTGGGDSVVFVEDTTSPYYYLESRIEDMMFLFGVSIPEDYEPEVTDYELWYDGLRIGERTPVNKTIRHLALAAKTEEMLPAAVRFYNGDTFVAECEFDPSVPKDILNFGQPGKEPADEEEEVGSWKASPGDAPGLCRIAFTIREGFGIRYYRLTDPDGAAIYSGEPIPVDESLVYLSVLNPDLGKLVVQLYDKEKKLIYEGRMDTETLKIRAERREEE